jgi:hypothetical protein
LILFSLNIAGAYCISIRITSIPGLLPRSNFTPLSIISGYLIETGLLPNGIGVDLPNNQQGIFFDHIWLKT